MAVSASTIIVSATRKVWFFMLLWNQVTLRPDRRRQALEAGCGNVRRKSARQNPSPTAGPLVIRNAARIAGDLKFVVAQDRAGTNETIGAAVDHNHQKVHPPDRFVQHTAWVGRPD